MLEGGEGLSPSEFLQEDRLPRHTNHWKGQGPATCRLVGLESVPKASQNHLDPALTEILWPEKGRDLPKYPQLCGPLF